MLGPQTATIVEAVKPRPLRAVLRVHSPAAVPQEVQLGSSSCFIGSGLKNTIVLSDPSVSRAHAEIRVVPDGILVTDLGSRNGTFYAGQRVGEITFPFGAEIRIANVRVEIHADLEDLARTEPTPQAIFRGLIGVSEAMRQTFAMISRLDSSLAGILILGESGVGKELIARAIHEGSAAKTGPFVAVNCGAFQKELIASQLFGHKRGAFTGAVEARRGAFTQADGGTLFLDEIGELPLDLQPLLLRALETREVVPVGSDHGHAVRVRVLAATNRDLQAEVENGTFREDLFYRLAVVALRIPPLRERKDDVAELARFFARQEGSLELPEAVVSALTQRRWPGNVRELRNAVQAYAVLGSLPTDPKRGTKLEALLTEFVDLSRPYHELKDWLGEEFQRAYLRELMRAHGGNQTAAAKAADMDRAHLNRLLQRYGIR